MFTLAGNTFGTLGDLWFSETNLREWMSSLTADTTKNQFAKLDDRPELKPEGQQNTLRKKHASTIAFRISQRVHLSLCSLSKVGLGRRSYPHFTTMVKPPAQHKPPHTTSVVLTPASDNTLQSLSRTPTSAEKPTSKVMFDRSKMFGMPTMCCNGF